MTFPDARTQLAGVVGHPVAHSLSPAIQNAALRRDGLNAVYLAFDVVPEALETFVAALVAAAARGLNVTLPHKGAAFQLSDEHDEAAERTGAVNTLVFADSRIVGHNTDVAGIREALNELGVEVSDRRILVVGAGGAGRAAAWAVADAGEIAIANRTAARAEALARRIGGNARSVPWSELAAEAARSDAVVQATSVGLDGVDGAGSVLDVKEWEAAAAGGCRALLDLVYGPEETRLVRAAREAGLRAADGLGVLVHQGAEAYALLWGREADRRLMHEAARQAAGR